LGKDVHEAKLSLNCRIATLFVIGFWKSASLLLAPLAPPAYRRQALRYVFPLCSKDAATIGFKLLKPMQYTCLVNPIVAEILFVLCHPSPEVSGEGSVSKLFRKRFLVPWNDSNKVDKKILAKSGNDD